MNQAGEISPEALFKQMSLRELSIAASNFNDNLSVACEDEDFVKICQEYITDATADKIDGYSFVASYKEAEIAAWKEKRSKLLELVDEIIHRQQRELEMLKASLLKMHRLGLIGNKLIGKTRTITIQSSPPKVSQLHIELNAPKFPDKFRSVRMEYKINTKALISAWKSGEDISEIADIEQGHHIRFRYK
ncbi:MAG TPA: hypothetical protein DEV81_27015 [Cyanobacteria bacterium UBA11049]|nr:hypothetical protein [Cyanobacteria bacterium UBA11049]